MGNTYYICPNCGDEIPKVYKSNNKLVISIPYDVINSLGIKDGDDLDFLKYGESTYIVAKKNDIVRLLAGTTNPEGQRQQQSPGKKYTPRVGAKVNVYLADNEVAVLKKLDTLKYNDRTSTKVASMLNSNEKATLQILLKKGVVVPFKKANEKDAKYSIQKSFYDTFVFGKNRRNLDDQRDKSNEPAHVEQRTTQHYQPVRQRAWEQMVKGAGAEQYISTLESQGYLVIGNEAEAAIVSSAMEESIRQGLIVGTRAFNKKFYIGLRGFINRYASKILKIIEQRSVNIDDIAKEADMDPDGARTVLYFLSESGDVTEVRRDIFRAA